GGGGCGEEERGLVGGGKGAGGGARGGVEAPPHRKRRPRLQAPEVWTNPRVRRRDEGRSRRCRREAGASRPARPPRVVVAAGDRCAYRRSRGETPPRRQPQRYPARATPVPPLRSRA